jgi:hypothetical protein
MAMQVSSASQKRRRVRARAHAHAAATRAGTAKGVARPAPLTTVPASTASIVAAASPTTAAATAPTDPVAAPAAQAATGAAQLTKEPAGPKNGYEFDGFEGGDFVTDWVINSGFELGGHLTALSQKIAPDEKFPWLATKYGKATRSGVVGWATLTGASIIGATVGNLTRKVMHGLAPGMFREADEKLVDVPPASDLVSGVIKKVISGMAKTYITTEFAPPPEQHKDPAPAPAPDPNPAPKPDPTKPKLPTFPRQPVAEAAKGAAGYMVSVGVGAAYDQLLAPFVKKTVNTIMGKGDAEISKPKPMNPGDFASLFGSVFLSGLIMRSPFADGPPMTGPAGAILGVALTNGLMGAAFDTVYDRSVGPAIKDVVNGAMGIAPDKREPETFSIERLMRSIARGAVSGTAYYLVDGLSQPLFMQIGAQLGGPMGAFAAMAGPAIAGMVAGTAADTLLGGIAGSIAGSAFSWITGKPAGEHRPAAPPPVEQPAAGAPPAAGATPGAPAATTTAKLKRKGTGNKGAASAAIPTGSSLDLAQAAVSDAA